MYLSICLSIDLCIDLSRYSSICLSLTCCYNVYMCTYILYVLIHMCTDTCAYLHGFLHMYIYIIYIYIYIYIYSFIIYTFID